MNALHISAECYPVAKVGGMGDVVGSLPRYLNEQGLTASVVMPKYDNEWIRKHSFDMMWSGSAPLGGETFDYRVERETGDALGFPLYVISIPGRFDRPAVYIDPETHHAYEDELERFVSFQSALLDWLQERKQSVPDLVHCHDHHMGMIPFMMSHADRYPRLREVPSIFTIHNAAYQGIYPLENFRLLPHFDEDKKGLLDWDGRLNALAAGIKSGWRVTTVSETYMEELRRDCNGLEILIDQEWQKCTGILNGIDTELWDPDRDPMIDYNFSPKNRKRGKRRNKEALTNSFNLASERPLISFIGRLVHEKGADLLPALIDRLIKEDYGVNFMILGKGDPALHRQFEQMTGRHVGYFDARLEYNEQLAHQMYAGSDFIIMPSRIEPCGLNQMYAMRYGAFPIVRAVGGLNDSVRDLNKPKGYGFKFEELSVDSMLQAITRALSFFVKERKRSRVMGYMMRLDFSWNASAREYIKVYSELTGKKDAAGKTT